MSGPLSDVGDTAYWVAWHRAAESARADALIHDPFAARLAGRKGEAISAAMRTSRIVAWTVVLRTRIIDAFIDQALKAGVDTVLCLGAGLDARPWRMVLPRDLRWIEADYPMMIRYKQDILKGDAPHCQLEQVEIDLADMDARQALLARVGSQSKCLLVLTEGVTPYLTNGAVAALATELHALPTARFWIADYFSKESLRWRRRPEVSRAMKNAPFRFEPGDWFAFFRERGWVPREVRYFPDEANEVGRPIPLPFLLKIVLALSARFASAARREAFRTSMGYVLLERSH